MRVAIDLDRQPQDKLRLIETPAAWRAFQAECRARHPGRDVCFEWSLPRPEELPALLVVGPLHAQGNRLTYRFGLIRNVVVEPAPVVQPEAQPEAQSEANSPSPT